MADGDNGGPSSLAQAMRYRNGRRFEGTGPDNFVLRFNGQFDVLGHRGAGVCDPDFLDERQSMEAWRYTTFFLQWVVTGGNLLLAGSAAAGGATVANGQAYDYGSEDAIPTVAGVNASPVITDLDREGAPIKEGAKFYSVALGVAPRLPYVAATVGGVNTRTYPRWLIDSYADLMIRATLEGLAISLSFGDQACEPQAAPLDFWPWHGGIRNGFTGTGGGANNGAASGPGNLFPLRRGMESGARDTVDQLTIDLLIGQGLRIDADPLNPVADGVTAVFMPLTLITYGFPQCIECVPCLPGTGGGSIDQAIAAAASNPQLAAKLARALEALKG